ncbi:MAG: rRNA maturation RNase YbeY [Candidatus Paceibacterota bacterium]|jgi:probable rRNA maturation factor
MKSSITIHCSQKKFLPLVRVVRSILTSSLPALTKKEVALEAYLVSNAEMKTLNRTFRGKDVSTNVLSFEAKEFPRADMRDQRYLGEIYLAPDVIKTKKEDIKLLTVHGLLHLFEYTHAKKSDRMRMERAEDRLLARTVRK